MPASELMLARLVWQRRVDTATRTIEIDNGPTLAYQARDRRAIRWVPEVVDLAWDSGLLCSCDVTGHRIRRRSSTRTAS